MSAIEWVVKDDALVPAIKGQPDASIAWAPQAGSQEAFLTCPVFECLISGPRGTGKAQDVNSIIYTPAGPIRAGDIKPGQVVLTPTGTAKVVATFDHPNVELYRVSFDDGTSLDVHAEHNWYVRPKKKTSKFRVVQTKDLNGIIKKSKKVFIPSCSPVQFDENEELPVDAYLLGLLLGDGFLDKRGPVLYSIDDEILSYGVQAGAREEKPTDTCRRARFSTKHPVTLGLKKLNLIDTRSRTKFIPPQYLYGSNDTRLAVLQGLLDTDGSVDGKGRNRITYTSVSLDLAEGAAFLSRSLGGRASVRINARREYTVAINPCSMYDPFRMKRKAARVGPSHRDNFRRLVSVEPVGIGDAICISLDSKDGLYLADDLIVTHNTDVLIMDFLQDVGKGFGRQWRGVLFRQTYPQLKDVIVKCQELIPQIFPDAKYNKVEHTWTFYDGEELMLSFAKVESDYWNWHGHNLTWIGWEELTTWADLAIYKKMFSTVRTTNKKIRLRVRATTNPYGVGHQVCKHRFNLPLRPGQIVGDVIQPPPAEDGSYEPDRVAIRSTLEENKVLLHADPNYIGRIRAAARNKAELAAWIDGSWDIVSGGMIDDIWDADIHVIEHTDIPNTWRITRSFDWGSSKPFSVGWWAESDGSNLKLADGKVMSTLRGDMFRIAEWYGWNGQPNEGLRMTAKDIGRGIRERETDLFKGRIVTPGPADSSIFDVQDGNSVATNMKAVGVRWTRAHKSPGSRKNGWQRMRELLKGALPNKDGTPREDIGLFVFDSCDQFRRTVPTLPRSTKDLDDVDTDAEDHIGDECRYRLYKGGGRMHRSKVRGH